MRLIVGVGLSGCSHPVRNFCATAPPATSELAHAQSVNRRRTDSVFRIVRLDVDEILAGIRSINLS